MEGGRETVKVKIVDHDPSRFATAVPRKHSLVGIVNSSFWPTLHAVCQHITDGRSSVPTIQFFSVSVSFEDLCFLHAVYTNMLGWTPVFMFIKGIHLLDVLQQGPKLVVVLV